MGAAPRLNAVKLPRNEEAKHSPNSKVPARAIRKSFEIARDSLRIPFHGLEVNSGVLVQEQPLPLSYFLQNWRWYIRGHWKQAMAAFAAYALTFFIWARLA